MSSTNHKPLRRARDTKARARTHFGKSSARAITDTNNIVKTRCMTENSATADATTEFNETIEAKREGAPAVRRPSPIARRLVPSGPRGHRAFVQGRRVRLRCNVARCGKGICCSEIARLPPFRPSCACGGVLRPSLLARLMPQVAEPQAWPDFCFALSSPSLFASNSRIESSHALKMGDLFAASPKSPARLGKGRPSPSQFKHRWAHSRHRSGPHTSLLSYP
jgi:hypothetical protein